jgi:hypothetical protein
VRICRFVQLKADYPAQPGARLMQSEGVRAIVGNHDRPAQRQIQLRLADKPSVVPVHLSNIHVAVSLLMGGLWQPGGLVGLATVTVALMTGPKWTIRRFWHAPVVS